METGELFAWGFDMFGQCLQHRPGEGPKEELRAMGYTVAHPTLVDFFPRDEVIEDVSCGVTFSLVLTKTGSGQSKIYTAGVYNFVRNAPTYEIETIKGFEEGVSIQKIVCGGFYACALTTNGELYTWGCTRGPDQANGSLLGRASPSFTMEPGAVALPERCVGISCSTYSVLAVTESGGALTWGDKDGNALGRGNFEETTDSMCSAPAPVDSTDGVNIVSGALSYTNGGVVDSSGEVRVWGGAAWRGGVGSGAEAAAKVEWSGVPTCYLCESLRLAHRHALVVFRKRGTTVLI